MPGSSPGMTDDRAAPYAICSSALPCSTGRYPADIARNVDGGVSSIASSIALSPCDNRPSTIAAPCPARSESFPRPPAPSRRQAIRSPAPAADAAASCRVPAVHDAARRPSRAREYLDAIALLPAAAKTVGVVAAAEEARAMAGRERGRFVEKEQLGPAPAAHHLAPPAPEFADAGDPGRARPALFQQSLGRGIMDDAAVAGEEAAMRRRR